MEVKEEAKEITNTLYAVYGSDTGYLFGLHPSERQIVEVIVKIAIEIYERHRAKKGGDE